MDQLLVFFRFIFATESYGGHYGPAFVTFFDQQNTLIKKGKSKGELITVSALMINKCVLVYSFGLLVNTNDDLTLQWMV